MPGPCTTTLVTTEEQRWRAPDGSGQQITTRYPTGTPASRHPRPTVALHKPGQLAAVTTEPLPTNPDQLRSRLLSIQPADLGPAALLRAWADVAGWHLPPRATRAAAIRMFCQVNTRDVNVGAATDRAGRTGTAITADHHGTRDLIIIDPRTGELLAYEHVALRDPGGLGITAPAVMNHTTYLTRARAHIAS